MCLPFEAQNLCSRDVSDHEQSKAAMSLFSPHEQNYRTDASQFQRRFREIRFRERRLGL